MGKPKEPFVPMVVDQTTIGGVQVIMTGLLFSGRVLPVGFICFLHEKIYKSQNFLEAGFMALLRSVFPSGHKPIFIMDRYYGRVQMIRVLNTIKGFYIMRAKSNVIMWIGSRARALSRFKYKAGKPVRNSNVIYRKDRQEAVDLVIYLALSIAYILLLLLGASSLGVSLRERFESKRTKPRHGTVNTMSVLTLATAMLSMADIYPQVLRQLIDIIKAVSLTSVLEFVKRYPP